MTMLKIAIQKSGRLHEGSIEILKECGLKVQRSKNTLIGRAKGFPAELLYLRDDDIPGYVADGVADMGIVGENVLLEKGYDCEVYRQLGFSSCRLSLAVPKDVDYTGPRYFEGKKIATSYPNLTQRFLQEKGVQADIHEISGSVEIAPNIGLAEGIADLVSTGSTLLSNGLKEAEVMLRSEAVCIGHKGLDEAKKELVDQLLFRLDTVLQAGNNKYILMNAPNENLDKVVEVLPGMRSPTVTPLAEEGWSSVHSVINEDEFWDRIEQLKQLGCEGILIVPIEKMIL